MILYADDTNMFFTGDDLTKLYRDINIDLEKIVTWLNANRLSLNINKSHCMLFTRKKAAYDRNIKINNEYINRVETTKFFAVYLDSKLTWKKQILYIKSKVAKGLGILCRARKVFTKEI